MTREEMWEEFESQLKSEVRTPITMSYDDSIRLAEMGIKDVVARWKKRFEQDPCDDAISRQYLLENCVVDMVSMPYVPINRIENAPPVKPQKTGHWITMPIGFKCSNCNELEDRTTKHCPNCGAKMESEESDIEPMYYPQVNGITPTVVAESEEV